VFTNLHQLERLVLYHNFITSIEPHVFDESANLSSLSFIDFGYNNITELEPWPAIRALERPMTFVFRHNSIRKFTNTLHWSFNCSSRKRPVFETQLDFHENDIRHITDLIDGWNIDGLLYCASYHYLL